MESETSKRSVNFSTAEENLLVCLAQKYRHILENKKSDTFTNKQKANCWVKIQNEFNAQSGEVYRNFQVLKKKYENIKKRTTKKLAEEKCYRFKTGGGPNKDFKFTEVDETILEVLGETRVQGLPSEFGGDAVKEYNLLPENQNEISIDNDCENSFDPEIKDQTSGQDLENIIVEVYDEEIHNNHEPASTEEKTIDQNWSKYNPDMLKTPKSKALKPAKNIQQSENVTKKVSLWAEVKASLEEEKKKYLEQEHETRIKCLKERHQVEIDIIKRESEVKITRIEEEQKVVIENLKEEHKLKREILEMEKLKVLKELRK